MKSEPGPDTARPTARMKRLYHRFSELLGGEPEDLWVFDPAEMQEPAPFLRLTHVPAWPANEACPVSSFQTLGMSERRMAGADYFAELHMAFRRPFTHDERLRVARYLADVATYPFEFGLKLNWWEVISQPGRLPFFEGCKHLLLHPRMSPEGFDEVDDPEGKVKVLYLVPITPLERHLIVEHGRRSFIDHVVGGKIDLLQDRFDPPEWYDPEEEGGGQ